MPFVVCPTNAFSYSVKILKRIDEDVKIPLEKRSTRLENQAEISNTDMAVARMIIEVRG